MAKRRSLITPWLVLGAIVIVGSAIALGIAGALGSEDITSTIPQSTLSGAAARAPAPASATAGQPAENTAVESDLAFETALPSAAVAAPAPASAAAGRPAEDTAVEPDPAFEAALRSAGISPRGWETDFSRHTIPYSEILSGGPPRDGIPPIDDPKFTTTGDAGRWLGDEEPVIVFELDGDARAYPLQIMTWHEIVNDVVGGVPVAVTFCPLCNSAVVFDSRLDGAVYDFGTSGKLRHSDLIMWDRQTESWWQQFTGEGIVGELAGKRLRFLPATIASYADFKTAHADGKVLSRDTGFARRYGENPYAGYDRADRSPFLFDGELDGRLLPMDRVVSVTFDDVDVAFPYSALTDEGVVSYTVGDRDLVVFFKSGTRSALDDKSISKSRDVGSTGVFDPHVDGQKLTFRAEGHGFVDGETGSVWNILGQAVEGPLSGKQLSPIVHGDHFWFAWGAFKPDTVIYQAVS